MKRITRARGSATSWVSLVIRLFGGLVGDAEEERARGVIVKELGNGLMRPLEVFIGEGSNTVHKSEVAKKVIESG